MIGSMWATIESPDSRSMNRSCYCNAALRIVRRYRRFYILSRLANDSLEQTGRPTVVRGQSYALAAPQLKLKR